MRSELDSISGIGEKSAEALMRHFKSLKRLKEAGPDEIAAVVGKARAKIITEHFAQPHSHEKQDRAPET